MSTDEGYRRPKRGFLTKLLLLALVVGAAAFGAIAISRSDLVGAKSTDEDTLKVETAAPRIDWIAAAPGRVEPKSGLVRVGAQLLGRIAEVTVKLNDKVEEGELLIRLDDEFHILSTEMRERSMQHLRNVRDLIMVSQFEDGHWPSNWMDGADAVSKPIDDPLYKKVIATGHHLEWLAIAPEELHPPRVVPSSQLLPKRQ